MPLPVERRGCPAAPGVVVGPLLCCDDVPSEIARPATALSGGALLEAAIARAIAQLQELRAGAAADAAEILEFQEAMLEDAALRAPALDAIAAGAGAAAAWKAALAAQLAEYDGAEDAYFRARGADLRDLRDRVLRCLDGDAATPAAWQPGTILLAEDLVPSALLERDWTGGGIALRAGSPAGHVALLARARSIPMVVGLGDVDIAGHETAALDGRRGLLVLSPDAPTRAGFATAAAAESAGRRPDPALLRQPALTGRGERVELLLNIAAWQDLADLSPEICDGIGLVRTELLFRGPALPDEADQLAAYRRILDWAGGRPVSIRTLDAGADKPVAGLTPERESNPFLGQRGLRLSLAHPDIFAVQLRALLRAAAHGPLRILLPMVTVPAELRQARDLLQRAAAELARARLAHRLPPLGIMVEVPAAALAIDEFDADFLSIGSNDLVQYLAAAGRDNASVAHLADPGSPALLRLLAELADHAARTGRELSLCGDMAADPALVPLLLRAGIRKLSVPPGRVGAVKAAVAAFGGPIGRKP